MGAVQGGILEGLDFAHGRGCRELRTFGFTSKILLKMRVSKEPAIYDRYMDALDDIEPGQDIRGHFVLLGAGASLATCPEGDANGKPLPLMRDLVDILNIESDLRNFDVDGDFSDFELIYSQLNSRPECGEFLQRVNDSIWDYFRSMKLPEFPTIYDKLLLSLRSKDYVATFNWDPLLWQAYARNYKHTKLPRPICLHGTVSLGHCQCEEPIVVSYFGNPCPKCGIEMQKCDLLYPIGQKNYDSSPFINAAWRDVRTALKRSMLFTIFGYAAPVSDSEAISILKEGWGHTDDHLIELIEIIDIANDRVLKERWRDFILEDNFVTMDNFHSTRIWRYPRRSCEVHWSTSMDCLPVKSSKLSSDVGWSELLDQMLPLIEIEKTLGRE